MKLTRFFLIAATMMIAIVTVSAHDFEVDGIYYDITSSTDLTVEVTYREDSYGGYSNDYGGAITIPSVVTYYKNTYSVTSIGERAFSNCVGLTTISIPESVTSIGNGAFCRCTNLTDIVIPNSVKSIGKGAFQNCSNLKSISIPDSVMAIGNGAFFGCI